MPKTKGQWIRLAIQVFFLALVTVLALLHQNSGGGPTGFAAIDAFCPFGSLEGIYQYLANQTFIQRLYLSNFVILGALIALTIVLYRYFCSWICALGTLQDLAHRLGSLLWKHKVTIPARIDRIMRWFKYGVLAFVLYMTWTTATLFIRPYDPFAAYLHISSGWTELWDGFSVGLIILVVSLIASIFVERFFCKYLCPLGAFLEMLRRLSPFKIHRDQATCTDCKLCDRKCPMNIKVSTATEVKSKECINCLECVSVCPTRKETLTPKVGAWKLTVLKVGMLGLAIYLGVIGIAYVAGAWQTKQNDLKKVVEINGELDPAGIKGYMTQNDISSTFDLPLADLYRELGFTESKISPKTQIKSIGAELGVSEDEFSPEIVREVVTMLLEPSTVVPSETLGK